MPSIEQCDAASGSVAALPSTLEIFDKFKPIIDNGKDSDSEESFHLLLEDDDVENQSVGSDGKGKGNHNEETEDEILNKFETLPSGTPDHIDPHIEDSILNDTDDDNVESNKENEPKIDENQENVLKNNEKAPSTEVKITYKFEDYENSCDGEFKSIYETDADANTEETEKGEESDKASENVEPMEVSETLPISDMTNENELEEAVDTFEDGMDLEQDDTNQDIANIIEKLGDQDDTQMEESVESDRVIAAESDLTANDILMADTSDIAGTDSKQLEPEQDPDLLDNDVEMTEDEPLNNEVQEPHKENEQQEEKTNSQEITFQDSMEESESSKETHSGTVEVQVPIIEENIEATEESALCIEEAKEQNEEDTLKEENIEAAEESPLCIEEAKQQNEEDTTKEENIEAAEESHLCIEEAKQQNEEDTTKENIEAAEESALCVEEAKQQNEEDTSKEENIEAAEEPALCVEEAKQQNEEDTSKEENIEAAEEPALCVEEEKQQNEEDASKEENIEAAEESALCVEEAKQQNEEDASKEENIEAAEEPTLCVEEAKQQNEDASKEENIEVAEESVLCAEEAKQQNEEDASKLEETILEEGSEEISLGIDEDEEKQTPPIENQSNVLDESEIDLDETAKDSVASIEENNQVEEKESSENNDVFKVPEQPQKDSSDLNNEKSNDKADEDEGDLLDISMVRETDEDDACAIADAIEDDTAMEDTDKETQASEKSDEEQSEKMETEQEGSDMDKDQDSNDDNDNAMGFDDLDDDNQMDADDSSNTEAPETSKNKVIEISESSKDSLSSDNNDSKALKDPVTEAENVEVEKDQETYNLDNSTVDDTRLSDKLVAETDDIVIQDVIASSDINIETDEVSDKVKDIIEAPVETSSEAASEVLPEEKSKDDDFDIRRSSLNKRSHSLSDSETVEVSAKKPKIDENIQKETEKNSDSSEISTENLADTSPREKLKTLTAFSSFMKCRKLTAKLSRSDLEQFCIQKICESLMLKSSEGELHQTLKKHEKTIENLRKDLQQLSKQCKDLDIVNRKLLNELKTQNVMKKPLVPLKITRSVGLQVRLNPGNEVPNQNRRRQPMTNSPQKPIIASPNNNVNRGKTTPGGGTQQTSVVRQVMQASPQKSLTPGQTTGNNSTAPMLSQALQKRPGAVVGKRTTTPVRKPGNPGVIDLTDEDDKQAKSPAGGNPIKIINKTMSSAGTPNKTIGVNKMGSGGKTVGKQVAVNNCKAIPVGPNKGNTLSQGIRLTPTSVISSSANGSPQMVYVVPTITSNAGGQQKVAFVNFQPTNGVLSGTLNGSTVSVMPNKQGQTLTLKTLPGPMRNKHPAPLPTPPRVNLDPKLKPPLPKPLLTIKKIDTGIILQWKMPYNLDLYESIASYQLYAYQETSSPPNTDMWRKVGDVKALALPMACTLTQFADKNKYYFAVRSVDVHKRIGAFSDPEEISL